MNSSDILLLLSDKCSLHLLCLTEYVCPDHWPEQAQYLQWFLRSAFWFLSIQLPVSLLFMMFSTARLCFVGINKIMVGEALGLWNFICSRTVKTIPVNSFGPGHLSLCKCDNNLPEPWVREDYVNSQVNTQLTVRAQWYGCHLSVLLGLSATEGFWGYSVYSLY